MIAYDQGLYTAKCFNQDIKYPATRARLMLRVKREGMYAVKLDKQGQDLTDSVPVINEGKDSYINSTTYLYIDNDTVNIYFYKSLFLFFLLFQYQMRNI